MAKFVPCDDQKQQCINVHHDLQERVQNDPTFLSKVITGDEKWAYGYDPETK